MSSPDKKTPIKKKYPSFFHQQVRAQYDSLIKPTTYLPPNEKGPSKMQMLLSTIVDPAPPQPYPPSRMSMYKQTRMKSSKDLVSHHLNKDRYFVPAPPSHHQPKTVADSVYVTTTRASPVKTSESPTKTQRLNPESSTRKRQSYVNTPRRPNSRSSSRNGGGSQRSQSSRGGTSS
jgi:hypothetical protein